MFNNWLTTQIGKGIVGCFSVWDCLITFIVPSCTKGQKFSLSFWHFYLLGMQFTGYKIWKASLWGCGSLRKKRWDHSCSRNTPIMLAGLVSLTQALGTACTALSVQPSPMPTEACLWPCRPCQQAHGHRNLRGSWQLTVLTCSQSQRIQCLLALLTWHRCAMCMYKSEDPWFVRLSK